MACADHSHWLAGDTEVDVINVAVFLIPPPRTPAHVILEHARAADRQGYHSVWLGDHVLDPRGDAYIKDGPLEALTMMAAIGAVTKRVRLGWGMLNPSFRNPALLAKMLATLDRITDGRVICSLGAGWFAAEHEAYGIPFIADHEDRIAHEREVIQLLKELWTRPAPERVTFEGRFVCVRDLPFNPAPIQQPHPPVFVGGDSEASLALACELANGWVPLTRGQPETIRRLRNTTSWPARGLEVVRLTHLIVGQTTAAAYRRAADVYATLRASRPPQVPDSLDEFVAAEVVGDVETCLVRLREMEDAGIGTHLVTFLSPDDQSAAAALLLPRLDT
jgi:alkanesulfonate monooxygenase SsuD/methylene tetrahydromethanopterin reductase-like flavin-dependent oxidoreductase (luciferase family)